MKSELQFWKRRFNAFAYESRQTPDQNLVLAEVPDFLLKQGQSDSRDSKGEFQKKRVEISSEVTADNQANYVGMDPSIEADSGGGTKSPHEYITQQYKPEIVTYSGRSSYDYVTVMFIFGLSFLLFLGGSEVGGFSLLVAYTLYKYMDWI